MHQPKEIILLLTVGRNPLSWRCVSRLENTSLFCDARTILESTIEHVLITAVNDTHNVKDAFLTTMQNNIATILSMKNDKP